MMTQSGVQKARPTIITVKSVEIHAHQNWNLISLLFVLPPSIEIRHHLQPAITTLR
jgi:hypothetical protein